MSQTNSTAPTPATPTAPAPAPMSAESGTPSASRSHGQRRTPRSIRLSAGHWGTVVSARTLTVALAMVAAIAVIAVWAMTLGDYPISPAGVVRAVFGTGDDPLAGFFVQRMRAPRVVLAVLVGAALGISGCIFQSLTANPLGSPDITGFTTGAATGAILQIIVFDGGPVAVAVGAALGGFVTGALVLWLSGGAKASGIRFVLIGLGVSFIAQGINSLLVVRASLSSAQAAAVWLAGSFNATTWPQTAVIGAALVVLIPIGLACSRPLSVMTTGEDLATGLGVAVAKYRLALIAVGVLLVAVAVAATGPIGFVALAAPQLAKRVARPSGSGMLVAGLMGALLVLASDVIAQRIVAPTQLPVGVVTGVLGGAYLIWLLAREWRKNR